MGSGREQLMVSYLCMAVSAHLRTTRMSEHAGGCSKAFQTPNHLMQEMRDASVQVSKGGAECGHRQGPIVLVRLTRRQPTQVQYSSCGADSVCASLTDSSITDQIPSWRIGRMLRRLGLCAIAQSALMGNPVMSGACAIESETDIPRNLRTRLSYYPASHHE